MSTARPGGGTGRAAEALAHSADEAEEIGAILRRINAVGLDTLPAGALRTIQRDLEDQREALRLEAMQLENELARCMERGEGVCFSRWRQEVRRIRHENEVLADEIRRLHDAHQRRALDDAMAIALGGKRRVVMLQALVLVLIFLVLGLLLFEALVPGLPHSVLLTIFLIDTACCAVFLTEFFLELRCADSKRWFWRAHWIDFVTSIPLPNASVLRLGRLARVARITRLWRVARMARFLRLVRGIRMLLFMWRGMDKLYEVLNVRLMKRSLAMGLAFLGLGSFVILVTEGRSVAHEAVDTPREALWWSFTTAVTGGFGDIHNPATAAGQLMTVVLVIAGMVVVGVFTATLTALMVGDESEEIRSLQRSVEVRLTELDRQVRQLSARLPSPGVSGQPGAALDDEA